MKSRERRGRKGATMKRSRLFNRGGLALVVLAAPLAFLPAQPPNKQPPPGGKRVRVSVVVILASERDNVIDRKLKCIADEVRKMDPRLTGFKMSKVHYRSLPVGAPSDFVLLDGQSAEVTVQRGADKKDRVRLKVSPPQMGEITYSTPCGKFLPIITPVRTRKNELVILAIRVQPCRGK
jgi:hypothetical protein